MSNYSKPGDQRYTVEIRTDTVMIYSWRYAGICGPVTSTSRPATMDEVHEWVEAQGFARVSDWRLSDTYEGLMLEADVCR